MKCFACLAEKDPSSQSVYPYPEDDIVDDKPIASLMTIECQSSSERSDFRMAVMCHECWHRLASTLGIDMWIGQACWESLQPVIPFTRLPQVKSFLPVGVKQIDYEKWNAVNYEPLEMPCTLND